MRHCLVMAGKIAPFLPTCFLCVSPVSWLLYLFLCNICVISKADLKHSLNKLRIVSNPLRDTRNNALVGLIEPPAMRVVLTLFLKFWRKIKDPVFYTRFARFATAFARSNRYYFLVFHIGLRF